MDDNEVISEDLLAARWIERMAGGDVAALDALYRLYHRPLLGVFTRILRDRFAAEEVLQDTFVRAYRRASAFDSATGTAFSWLVTIGKRLAIDRYRRMQVRPGTENWEQPEEIGDKGKAREDLHAELEIQWMEGSLNRLPENQRQVIEMAFFEGYTHHEMAKRLKRPVGTVKSDLYRGLAALRKKYEEGHD